MGDHDPPAIRRRVTARTDKAPEPTPGANASRINGRLTAPTRRIPMEGADMSIISKESIEQDKRSLTVFLIYLNVVLAGAFLLACFYTA
jgi:hypothetical protein